MASPRFWSTASVAVALLVLSACGGEDAASAPDGTTPDRTSATSSSQSPSSRTSTSTSPSSHTSTVAPAPAPVAAAGPTFVECVYGGGAWTDSALMSDGSFRTHPTCAALRAEQLARYPYVCPRTDHHVADLSECGPPVQFPAEPTSQPADAAVTDEPSDEGPVGEEAADEAVPPSENQAPTEIPGVP